MRPLPRLHAVTDARILDLPDFGVRAAAIAAAGPAVALHARDRRAAGARLAEVTRRILSLARPPEAAVLVNGHPELARALGAQGVQLGRGDLSPADARAVMGSGWIGCSVHSEAEAEEAALGGADFLLAGTIFPTASHPDVKPAGPELVRTCSRTGLPVIAIGGITAANLGQVLQAGAWGVATISAAWLAPDPAQAVVDLLAAVNGAA